MRSGAGLRALRALLAVHVVGLAWLFVVLPAFGFVLGTRPAPKFRAPAVHPNSKFEPRGELWHAHLAGSPLERGYACGSFTAPMMEQHEAELFGTMESLVPWFAFRHLILGSVTFNNRALESYLSAGERDAIGGIALGYRAAGDPNAHVGPAYGRILGYHALHDASQYLIDNPLVNAPMVGCSAVALAGGRTLDEHLLVGRLFDFEGGRSFDLAKVVYTVDPEGGGLRFCHVAWGGIHGAVTGMNEAGLWISVNAGVSDHLALSGRPLVVAVHHALLTCRTIDEAVAHLTAQPVFVSESVLIASPSCEPRAVVLELSPAEHHVRVIVDDALAVANHFEHPGWETDRANAARRREGTTTARRTRLQELVNATERHTPTTVLEIFRDRRGAGAPGGVDLGFGHRSAINAWIGAHLVVADLTRGVLWVCEPSHGLGAALAFDVHGPRDDVTPLPPSDDLELFERDGRDWKPRLEAARRAVAARDLGAIPELRRMIEVNSRHPEPYALLARLVADRGEADALRRASLDRQPAYASEVRALEAALAR